MLASAEAKLILCKACIRSGIYGGRFATDYHTHTHRRHMYDRPVCTLELLFARIRLPHERQDNPESPRRSAFPGAGSNRAPNSA